MVTTNEHEFSILLVNEVMASYDPPRSIRVIPSFILLHTSGSAVKGHRCVGESRSNAPCVGGEWFLSGLCEFGFLSRFNLSGIIQLIFLGKPHVGSLLFDKKGIYFISRRYHLHLASAPTQHQELASQDIEETQPNY